jgi:hypothetical protein
MRQPWLGWARRHVTGVLRTVLLRKHMHQVERSLAAKMTV